MAHYNFGIPDIELRTTSGRTLNPSTFAGHALVMVFCPTSEAAEAAEAAEYKSRGCDFAKFDAWVLTVGERAHAEGDANGPATLALDPDGNVWTAFSELAGPILKLNRDDGASFLFERGGSLAGVWGGPGRAAEVLEALSDGARLGRQPMRVGASAITA